MENIYYVYVYLNPLKKGKFVYYDIEFEYEPFYVGKGKGNRYKSHLNGKYLRKKKNNKNNTILEILENNNEPIIIKLFDKLTEIDSYSKEIETIKKIGCVIYNNGPLTNLTTGGEGAMSTNISDETRKKCGDYNRGKTLIELHGIEKGTLLKELSIKRLKLYSDNISGKTYEDVYGIEKSNKIKNKKSISMTGKIKITEDGRLRLKEKMRNRKISVETKDRISKSLIGNKRNLGKTHTDETKDKISKSKIGSVPHNIYKIIQFDINMNFIKEWNSSTEASKTLGISQGNITNVIRGKRNTASGYIWRKK